jgi:hypothetical protein
MEDMCRKHIRVLVVMQKTTTIAEKTRAVFTNDRQKNEQNMGNCNKINKSIFRNSKPTGKIWC